MLSRSTSSALGYDLQAMPSLGVAPAGSFCTSPRLRKSNGRFVSRKRARTPERPTRKHISSMASPDAPRKSRSRRIDIDSEPPSPAPTTPKSWAVGEGGLGTLGALPKEIRQIIYGYTLNVTSPVIVRACCGPGAPRRERDSCRKHDASTRKFGVLQISKAINNEASWVLYSQGSLHIDVDHAITPYLDGQTKSLRHLGKSIGLNKKKMALWYTAARFRSITICVPNNTLQHGDPVKFTGQVLEIACLLGNVWEGTQIKSTPISFVSLDLGALFHQMLPFNMESQAEDKYEELVFWVYDNHPIMDPDYEELSADCAKNLKKLACKLGMQSGCAQWKILATGDVEEKDEGGDYELWQFRAACEQNGVAFEHTE